MPGLNQLLNRPRVSGKILFKRNELSPNQESVIDYLRIPTYVLPFDYATAGGIPCNVTTQFYGPYSSGKSTISYLAAKGLSKTCMRCLQPVAKCKCPVKSFVPTCPTCGKPVAECNHKSVSVELCETCGKPRLECTCHSRLIQKTFLCHLEGMPPDDLYFKTLGYNSIDNLIIGLPDYGEQACEMIEAAVQSDDCGLIIVDSIADIVPKEELECAYEDVKVAMQARLIARLFRRLAPKLVQEYRRGHLLGVIFINQVRSNIGGGRFAPGETTPGGWAAKHGHRLSVRLSQLSIDAKSGERDKDDIKNIGRFSCSMLGAEAKQQMLILAGKAEYRLVFRDWDGYPAGSTLDANTCITLSKETGFLQKTSSGYEFVGTGITCRVLSEIEDIFRTNKWVNKNTGEELDGAADIIKFTCVRHCKYFAIKDIMSRHRKVTNVANPLQPVATETDLGVESEQPEEDL